MFVTYPYRNYLSRYAAGFVDTERREGPESLATVPISVARPGRGAGGRRAAGPALGTSRMQFTNTSDATLQTDTNQHNAGGELHATLLNNEPYQHTRPHPMGGRRGADQRWRAWPRCRWVAAGPGRASRSTIPSEARVWRSRGRAAAHRHAHRPGPTQQDTRRSEICRGSRPHGARNTSGVTSNAGHQVGPRQHEAARPHRGPGGSRFRPLGGCQRLFQRIWVPSEPRRWQASTTRAAMPASADLPHVRGSYCFFTPTSPSILRTPS